MAVNKTGLLQPRRKMDFIWIDGFFIPVACKNARRAPHPYTSCTLALQTKACDVRGALFEKIDNEYVSFSSL
jgi:hypothetical protein